MANTTVECGSCGEPTQQVALDGDGHCSRCSTCRTSNPPPEPTSIPDVSRFQRGRHGRTKEGLHRAPLSSKIPIAAFLEREALNL